MLLFSFPYFPGFVHMYGECFTRCNLKKWCINGICRNLHPQDMKCICYPHYAGFRCEKILCYPDFCESGSTCIVQNGERICLCPPEWRSQHCRKIHGRSCEWHPSTPYLCENLGECDEVRGEGYKCFCLSGYSGERCEIKHKKVSLRAKCWLFLCCCTVWRWCTIVHVSLKEEYDYWSAYKCTIEFILPSPFIKLIILKTVVASFYSTNAEVMTEGPKPPGGLPVKEANNTHQRNARKLRQAHMTSLTLVITSPPNKTSASHSTMNMDRNEVTTSKASKSKNRSRMH